MSSVDESLEKQFKEVVRRKSGGKSKEFLGIDDLIEWFKSLQVFEHLQTARSDIEVSFKKICDKYKGSTQTASASSGITSKDFIKILEDLAAQLKIKAEEFKNTVLEIIENREQYEKMLKETVEKGQKGLESITEWLYNSFEQFKIAKSDLEEAIKNAQENRKSFTYDELVQAVGQIAVKYNIDADKLLRDVIKNTTNPGFLPPPDDKK